MGGEDLVGADVCWAWLVVSLVLPKVGLLVGGGGEPVAGNQGANPPRGTWSGNHRRDLI